MSYWAVIQEGLCWVVPISKSLMLVPQMEATVRKREGSWGAGAAGHGLGIILAFWSLKFSEVNANVS